MFQDWNDIIPMKNTAGREIRKLRSVKQPRMTQAELARALQLKGFNIDRSGVAKIEGGFRKISDIELITIADILGVPAGDLLQEPNNMPNQTEKGIES